MAGTVFPAPSKPRASTTPTALKTSEGAHDAQTLGVKVHAVDDPAQGHADGHRRQPRRAQLAHPVGIHDLRHAQGDHLQDIGNGQNPDVAVDAALGQVSLSRQFSLNGQ